VELLLAAGTGVVVLEAFIHLGGVVHKRLHRHLTASNGEVVARKRDDPFAMLLAGRDVARPPPFTAGAIPRSILRSKHPQKSSVLLCICEHPADCTKRKFRTDICCGNLTNWRMAERTLNEALTPCPLSGIETSPIGGECRLNLC
jgi:hypothetical protein